MSAAAAAAVELPLLAALWLGHVDGSRLVGVAFLDPATRCDQRGHSSNSMLSSTVSAASGLANVYTQEC